MQNIRSARVYSPVKFQASIFPENIFFDKDLTFKVNSNVV